MGQVTGWKTGEPEFDWQQVKETFLISLKKEENRLRQTKDRRYEPTRQDVRTT